MCIIKEKALIKLFKENKDCKVNFIRSVLLKLENK